ncbi:MAG: hypothetical protein WAW88_00610 [Nocardioides sp.]
MLHARERRKRGGQIGKDRGQLSPGLRGPDLVEAIGVLLCTQAPGREVIAQLAGRGLPLGIAQA